MLSFPVVGIGASAGGLEAVKEMFSAVKPDCGMAFVLVQHLDPNHESLMAELISRSTDMTVRQIRDGDVLEPNCLFVVPPGKALTVDEGRLLLRPFEVPRGLRRPIDSFFSSLARSQGANAGCVVLSGTGADGTAGLRVVKERGGISVAQTPDTARYDGMPTAALGTGLVDFERSPEKIVPELASYFSRRGTLEALQEARVVANHIDQLCDILQDVVGHDFNGYKRPTMTRRIERRMQILDIETAEEYIAFAREDGDECEALFRDLLIHVTNFFRDPDYFERLNEQVIEPLMESGAKEVRVWVAGCSTGEEAYTIAMLMAEAASKAPRKPLIHIFATDISDDMLKIAREARYPSSALLDIPEHFREKYTIGLHGQFQISPRIRDMVRFSSHSLIKDPPFSRLDLITCRNLLIYMGDKVQKSLIPLMHYALKPQGVLFLGPSESLSRREDLFAPIDQKSRIFRRMAGSVSYPMNLPIQGKRKANLPVHKRIMPSEQDFPVRETGNVFSRTLLERYAPASVLLSPDGDVIASQGELAKYFKLSIGGGDDASRHVSSIARGAIREVLPGLLKEAIQSNERRAARDVEVASELGTQTVDLIVDPLADGTVMAVFMEVASFRQQLEPYYAEPSGRDDRVGDLEEELRLVRFRLRGTVEELETANEELKSSNEEMMSMNEELQSANEELSTVNEELKNKIDEVDSANADLKNILTSARTPLVIVDETMRVRTFTKEVQAILPLVDTDRGRPLADVSTPLDGIDLIATAGRVLAGDEVKEQTVTTKDGTKTYLARVMPYRSVNGDIAGATMTFSDITSITRLQRDVEAKSQRLELALSFGNMGVWEYDPDTQLATLDKVEARLLDFPADKPIALEKVFERIEPEDHAHISAALEKAEKEGELYDEIFRIRHRNGDLRLLRGIGRIDTDGHMIGLNFDITEDEQMKADKDLLFKEMNHRVKNLFAVISSIIGQAARTATSTEELTNSLRGRILALSRAHAVTLSRESTQDSIMLRDLLEVVLGPSLEDDSVSLEGPAIEISAQMTTPFGLILHELATNSAKYGALSASSGKVGVSWLREGDEFCLDWAETGGPKPKIAASEDGDGGKPPSFGTTLIDGSVNQLGGSIERKWSDDGLDVTIRFPIPDLARHIGTARKDDA